MKLQSFCLILGLLWNSHHVKSTGEGDVRLIGGDGYLTGTVEIYHNFRWGTVCDDGWDIYDAYVVCRQLGLGPAIRSHDRAYFGTGNGQISLDDVACLGTEYRLDQCQHSGWYNHNCDLNEAAGVECSYLLYPTTFLYWTTGSLRLRDGSSENEGRVEVYWYSDWYTVCDDSWDITDASVVCRQLGYVAASRVVTESGFGDGDGEILLDDVRCTGYERTLLECDNDGLFIHDCGRNEIAGVVCYTEPTEIVRLAGGLTLNSGRVELYNNGSWGTVCDDNWGYEEASVICRQLGFLSAESVYFSAYFGQGWGPILQYLDCNGNESQWMDCFYRDWGLSYCSHEEDAGVTCRTLGVHHPRLANGDQWHEGRVEIWNGYQWTKLCSDELFSNNEANVICKELGLDGVNYIISDNRFGEGNAPPSDVYYSCTSYENSLSQCYKFSRSEYYCTSAALRCNYNESLSAGAVVGFAIGSILFIFLCCICCVAICKHSKALKNRRRNPSNVTAISGSTNQAGPTVHFAAQPAVPSTNGNVQAPPSYDDVINNPAYYPHFAFDTHAAGGHVTVINASCPPYPVHSNPPYPNIHPPNMAYPPPSNVAYPRQDRLPPVHNPSNFQTHPPVGDSEVPIQNGEPNSIEDSGIYSTIDST